MWEGNIGIHAKNRSGPQAFLPKSKCLNHTFIFEWFESLGSIVYEVSGLPLTLWEIQSKIPKRVSTVKLYMCDVTFAYKCPWKG